MTADLQMNAGKARYDVILWSSLSAQDIQEPTGDAPAQCYASSLPDRDESDVTSPFVRDLEASEDYVSDSENEVQAVQATNRDALDQCRDVVADGSDPLISQDITITQNAFLPRIDTDNDGKVNVQFMVTWANDADTINACGSGGASLGPGVGDQLTSKCDAVVGNIDVDYIVPASLTIVKNTIGGNGVFDFSTTGFEPTSPLDNVTGH